MRLSLRFEREEEEEDEEEEEAEDEKSGQAPPPGTAPTERARRSARGVMGGGSCVGYMGEHSCPAPGALSVSWRHLSKQPAVKPWWAPR